MKVMPLLKDHRGVFRWAPRGCPIVFEDIHFIIIQKSLEEIEDCLIDKPFNLVFL